MLNKEQKEIARKMGVKLPDKKKKSKKDTTLDVVLREEEEE